MHLVLCLGRSARQAQAYSRRAPICAQSLLRTRAASRDARTEAEVRLLRLPFSRFQKPIFLVRVLTRLPFPNFYPPQPRGWAASAPTCLVPANAHLAAAAHVRDGVQCSRVDQREPLGVPRRVSRLAVRAVAVQQRREARAVRTHQVFPIHHADGYLNAVCCRRPETLTRVQSRVHA
eukprot:5682543-Pleurochrysis_carterae.AAC.2